jgi:hypothetical protein
MTAEKEIKASLEITSRNWAARLEADQAKHAMLRTQRRRRERTIDALLLSVVVILFAALGWVVFEAWRGIQ